MKQPVLEKGRKQKSSSSKLSKKREAFAKDIQKIKLQKYGIPNKGNTLKSVKCFLGQKMVSSGWEAIYCNPLSIMTKHPAKLPKKSHLSVSIVKHYHERDQGRGMTVNELCANGIWILGCGSVISSHICKCVECRRYRRFNEW